MPKKVVSILCFSHPLSYLRKGLIHSAIIAVIFVNCFSGLAIADLIAYWSFDEGTGNVAYDDSGFGTAANGVFVGAPVWVGGVSGSPSDYGIRFNGSSDYLEIGYNPKFNQITNNFTFTMWVRYDKDHGSSYYQHLIVRERLWALYTVFNESVTVSTPALEGYARGGSLADDKWHHIAGVYDGFYLKLYVDGELVAEALNTGDVGTNTELVTIGTSDWYGGFFSGVIDDVSVYSHTLTAPEIEALANPQFLTAWNPLPADGSTGYTDVILSWIPGASAVEHNVYLGDDPCDVANANLSSPEYKQTSTQASYNPEPDLDCNKVYYWRVDEINGANVWPGSVWSFSTVPSPEDYIQALDVDALNARLLTRSAHTREVVDLIMQGCKPFIITPDYGGYGDPSAGVNYWRTLMEDAKATAVLCSIDGYWDAQTKAQCLARAKREIAQVALAYQADLGILGWGYGSWIMGDLALGAWFIWDDLDKEVQRAIAEALVMNADHYIGRTPPSGYIGDTMAESNAWQSEGMVIASNMMPNHPHNTLWDYAAKKWLYNIRTVAQDLDDTSAGDDGIPVNQWVVGANLYPDYGIENHNIFSVDYYTDCYNYNLAATACYWLAGNDLPLAVRHHALDLWQNVIAKITNYEKFWVFIGDNDWHRYHHYSDSITNNGFIAVTEQNSFAAAIETQGLRNAVDYWSQMPAGFSYDNPYQCGKPVPNHMAVLLLSHILAPTEPEPLSSDQVETQLAGTAYLQSVNALMQYSQKGSFRSWYANGLQAWPNVKFVAAPGTERLLLPIDDNFSSGYLPDGASYKCDRGPDWFWALRYDSGGYEAFISLPDEVVIYMEYIPATMHEATGNLENYISVEKAYFDFWAYFDTGAAIYHPDSGWQRTDNQGGASVTSNWINLDDSIGYVVASQTPRTDAGMTLPPGSSRGTMRLQSQPNTTSDGSVCIVIFPNQAHNDTARMASQTQFAASTSSMSCTVGNISATVDFGTTNIIFTRETSSYAYNPCPEDGGVASPYEILSWLGAAGADSYIVYLGKDEAAVTNATTASPECIGEQAACSYRIVNPLDSNTTYYWRVDSRVGETINKGSVWSFTAGAMIGHWTMDEGAGTTVHDTSGYGTAANGSFFGSPIWVSGQSQTSGDYALNFDGIDDYLACTNNTKFNLTDQLTIAAWVKMDAAGTHTYQNIVVKGTVYGTYIFNKSLATSFVGSADWARDSTNICDGNWHQVVGVVDDKHLRLFIDGVQQASTFRTNFAIPTDAKPLYIGAQPVDWHEYLKGTIDDVRLYNYGMTNIEAMYLSGTEWICLSPPAMDFNSDCQVDFADLAEFCTMWLTTGELIPR